ncbi:hypothetical protein HZB74_02155 [Candidatus Saccharibacteria bacterium]|nr:hypothetical protein [Candidatus Saccharibacteria bacterium]
MIGRFLRFTGFSQADEMDQAEKFRRNVIRHEAKVGGELFGPVPKGVRREFFCLDEHTWIWHEEWSENGQSKSKTTRYSVRPNGIVKAQDGHGYHLVKGEEAKRLLEAARAYQKRVEREVYRPILSSV